MENICKHFGKPSEELEADVGMSWILEHCENCPKSGPCCEERKRVERDNRLLEGMAEAEKLERDYKRAIILLARQIPDLIQEMQLLRGAINRSR